MCVSNFEQQILCPLSDHLINGGAREAFLIAGTTYSYAQLKDCVMKIRGAVSQSGSDEKVWALAVHDDLETYASIIALWMEGRAYVPLHPNQPLERNLNIIEQVGTRHLLDSATDSVYINSATEIITTSALQGTECDLREWQSVSDNELGYILFTSGSTGVPKGVCISRRNISAFIDSFWQTGIELGSTDRCLQAFDLTFDVSVQSFLVALIKGACVCTIPYGQVKYLYAASLMIDEGITFGAMAPSMLTYLRPYFDELEIPALKACILTAEACPVDLMEDWYKCAVNTEIYDFYGPTEATIYCTYYKLNRAEENLSANGIISIGKPLANVTAVILDEKGKELGVGDKGELCVAGDQITPGYWKNDEKNTTSFFEMELNGEKKRFYRTGDLCYWDGSGNIIYLGRIDQQAKIQGYRVELGEIEYHARRYYNNEKRVVALAFQNEKNLTEVALFIESEEQNTQELVEYLKDKMPHYMIPSQYLFEPSFPLNNSDKIDRTALKQRLL